MPFWIWGLALYFVLSTFRHGDAPQNPEATELGLVWGTPRIVPQGWNPSGQWIYMDPDCKWVIEGTGFLGDPNLSEERYDSLLGNLEAGNSAWAYVRRLEELGRTPEMIAQTIFFEIAPTCFNRGPARWGPVVTGWYRALLARITAWTGGG